MAEFLKKALLSLVMDKQAREKLELVKKVKALEPKPGTGEVIPPSPAKGRAPGPVPAAAETAPEAGADRDHLIREALAVRREKAKLLKDLSPEDQFKLKVMAAKAFMGDLKGRREN